MRRAGIPGVRVTPQARQPKIALWVSDETNTLIGYTAAQIASSYSGTPAVRITVGASPCFFGVLHDGAIVVGTNTNDYWFILPKALQTYSNTLDLTTLRRIPVGSGVDTASQVTQFPNGDVMLSHNKGSRLTLQELYSGAVGLLVDGLAVAALDTHVDAAGNLWVCDINADSLTRFTAATVAAAGTATADKAATGTNFNGITSFAFDASGGVWHVSYDDNALRYHNAAAVAALNGTPSNPAPTRSVTGLTGGLESIVLDRDGNAWVATYDTADIYLLTAAQLTAGGAQAATRTVQTPLSTISIIRMSSGAGLYLR